MFKLFLIMSSIIYSEYTLASSATYFGFGEIPFIYVILIVYASLCIIMFKSPNLRRAIFSSLLLRNEKNEKYLEDDYKLLLKKVEKLEEKFVHNESTDLKSRIEDYLDSSLYPLIQTKVSEISESNSDLFLNLNKIVKETLKDSITESSLKKMIDENSLEILNTIESKERDQFDSLINSELSGAKTIKVVMINTFILSNFAIIVFVIFQGHKYLVEGPKSFYPILGLYISLATFIIYVYKTSNQRIKMLISILEDRSKCYNFFKYVRGRVMNEVDHENLKLLMTNRSEREATPNHPYEIVLKGLTSSNVFFKNGKNIQK